MPELDAPPHSLTAVAVEFWKFPEAICRVPDCRHAPTHPALENSFLFLSSSEFHLVRLGLNLLVVG